MPPPPIAPPDAPHDAPHDAPPGAATEAPSCAPPRAAAEAPDGRGGPIEVLLAFLRLGLTSFGGPVAHLGYFRTEFVERRRWLDEHRYADLVALCQFLPGPASSQVGMALGLRRAGPWGGLAAWLGFTLPSALLLILFAYGIGSWQGFATSGALHGLKVVAVAVVAQAVWGMARTLCPDRPRAALAIVAALLTLALPATWSQVGVIVAAGVAGWLLLPAAAAAAAASPPALAASSPGAGADGSTAGCGVSRRAGVAALLLFAVLLLGLPLVAAASGSTLWSLVDGFYRAGALVFGGGHVVLPLLEAAVVPGGAVDESRFLAGYGAAQAVPGPLFTFAAYLGASMQGGGVPSGWIGGLLFLVVIFVPATLLVVGALPFWESLRQRAGIRAALAGINAAVVGLLLAALYDPVWTSAIHGRADFALALAAFGLLVWGRVSPVIVVAAGALVGWAMS